MQPECAQRLAGDGWKFEWQAETGFVEANHPIGGKQSVVEVLRIGRSDFDRDEIGRAIASLLNGHQGQHR